MNREIKFRGKRTDNGEWVIGDLLRNRGETFIAPDGIANPLATADDFKVDPNTVGQFTGIKDKNGREIYEEDVLCKEITHKKYNDDYNLLTEMQLYELHPENYKLFVICWVHNEAAFCFVKTDSFKEFGNMYSESSMSGIEKMFVIGNIHDNPDLLK